MRTERLRHWARFGIALACHYSGLDAVWRAWRGGGVVILMFHRVRDDVDALPLSITPTSFWTLVDWLRDDDLLCPLGEALTRLEQGRVRGHCFVLTLDDGYHDNLELLARGKPPPAIVYLASGAMGGATIWPYRLAAAIASRRAAAIDLTDLDLGTYSLHDDAEGEALLLHLNDQLKRLPAHELESQLRSIISRLHPKRDPECPGDMLSWNEVKALADAGVEIGSQTVSHAIVARLSDTEAEHEIAGSRTHIEAQAGLAARHFAYPNGTPGDFTDRDVELVRRAGYDTATTTIEGVNRRGADRYRLLRHNLHETRFLSPFGRLSRALFFSETSGVLGSLRSLRNG